MKFVKQHGMHNSWCLSQTGEIEFKIRKRCSWLIKLDHWNFTRVFSPNVFL